MKICSISLIRQMKIQCMWPVRLSEKEGSEEGERGARMCMQVIDLVVEGRASSRGVRKGAEKGGKAAPEGCVM